MLLAQEKYDSLPVIQPIPIVELPQFLERTNKLNNEVAEIIKNPKFIITIDSLLSDPDNQIKQKFETLSDSNTYLSIMELESELRKWQDAEVVIKAYNQKLTSLIQSLQMKEQEVARTLIKWDTSLVVAKQQNAPDEIIKMVNKARNALIKSRKNISKKIGEVLKLQAALTPYFTLVGDAKSLIEAKKDDLLNNLWFQDAPVIWNVTNDTTKSLIHIHLKDSFQKEFHSFRTYFSNDETYRISLLILFFFCFGYLIYFRIKQRKNINKYIDLKSFNLMIKNPVLASTVLTLITTSIFFDLPRSVTRLYSLVLLLPVILFIYKRADKKKGLQVLSFLILILLLQVTFYIEGSNWIRFHVLFLSVLLSSGILMLTSKKYDFGLLHLLNIPLIRFYLNLLAYLCIFSVGFNISGRFELAKLLLIGSLGSIYLGMVYYVGVTMLSNLISILIIGTPLEKSYIIKSYYKEILKRVKRVIGFVAIFLWVYYTLYVFRISETITDWILYVGTYEIKAGSIKLSLSDLFAFFLTIQISVWLSRLIRFILEKEVYSRRKSDGQRSHGAILLIIRYSFISLGVLFAFAAAGIELSSIAVLLGALGVGIGFGLQSIFNNLVSGIILAVERPIQVGDIVEVHNTLGFVRDIGFRASTIQTYEGAEVIVPNGDFISSKVINYTLSDKRRRIDIEVHIDYREDPERIIKMLYEITEGLDFILKEPATYIRFKAMGESTLEFQVRAWISDFDNGISLGSQLTLAIFTGLRERGVEIPFPSKNIIVKDQRSNTSDN